ncbi:MAG TPA: DUF72 domain-containing protein [Gemmatimonadales bacterium]|nr:DUF72 domain-containing protein [Gemmatimonadales bacterium]
MPDTGAPAPDLLEPAALQSLGRALPPLVRFGTSTWSYPGWQGLVYRRAYSGRGVSTQMLEEYARFPLFRTVGIDSTFYAPPTEQVLRGWAERLPPGFPCVSKVWQQLTVHTWTKAQDPAKAGHHNPDFLNPHVFLEAVCEPCSSYFAGHTGPLVFEFQQIPRLGGLAPQEFADRLDVFFGSLPRDFQYAVEVRNEEFLTPAYFAVLREHDVAHVFNSWTRMPPIGAQLDLPGSLTAPFVVARALLRPGRSYDEAVDAFAPYRRILDPDPEVRQDLVRLARLAVAANIPAYILVNNRLEGSAPLTILALATMLGSEQ